MLQEHSGGRVVGCLAAEGLYIDPNHLQSVFINIFLSKFNNPVKYIF